MKPACVGNMKIPDYKKVHNGLTRKQYIVTQLCAGDLASQSSDIGAVSDNIHQSEIKARIDMLARFADEILKVE